MRLILLASPHVGTWQVFAEALGVQSGADIVTAENGASAIDAVKTKRPWAVVISEILDDRSDPSVVRDIMSYNAMIHIAMVSGLPQQAFHERTEGLGILMQLPLSPGLNEALSLSRRLIQITGIA